MKLTPEVSIATNCEIVKLFDGFPTTLSKRSLKNSLPFSSIEERYDPSSVIGAENMYRIFWLRENASFRISSHWTGSKSITIYNNILRAGFFFNNLLLPKNTTEAVTGYSNNT